MNILNKETLAGLPGFFGKMRTLGILGIKLIGRS